jgi:hypothetical protein
MRFTEELCGGLNPALIRRRDSSICLSRAAQERKTALLARRRGADIREFVEMAHECLRRSKHYRLAARQLGWHLPG